jgi:2-methylcitrate dehydratase PrpD
MLDRPDVTRNLSRFICETEWDDISPGTVHEAKRALLNFFAVAFAGSHTGPVDIALNSLKEFSDKKQATVVGRTERVDALTAAFLNAASANVFDFCDTHLPTIIHPTSPLAPSLFALAELRPASGRDLLLAFILGFEVECRIGRVISPGHYARGWHITSTCGIFGAAAGAAKQLGLTEQQALWALGNASTQSSGLCECLGWPAKSLSVGNAARNGLWSALLAARDFAGPPEPLSGVQGFFNAMGEPPNWAGLTNDLGDSWEIDQNSIKPYPCGFVIHPVLDAILEWKKQNPAGEVRRVVVRGNPLLAIRTDRPDVATGREAQVSVQHAVAAALVFGSAGVRQFSDTAALDPRVLEQRSRVEVIRDEAFTTVGAQVEIWTTNGAVHRHVIQDALGSPKKPMSDADVETKLLVAAADCGTSGTAQALIDAVWSMDTRTDVGAILRLAALR